MLLGKVLLAVSLIVSAEAATEIRFEPRHLDAARVLVKPETTSVLLDGKKGTFLPGSTLQVFGVEPEEFDVDMGLGGNLADVRFNHLQARGVSLTFEQGRIRVEIPFVDQEKGIRSALGSMSFRGVSVVAWVKPTESFAGVPTLALDGVEIYGKLKGSGLLSSSLAMRLVKNAITSISHKQLDRVLARPTVRAAIERGVVMYAQFSENPKLERYVSGSLRVSERGIVYQAE